MKRGILAVVAVYVTWFVLDMVIHVGLLGEAYRATAELWRPEAEMKMGLMQVVSIIAATGFVSIYALLISKKSMASGLKFGLLYGIAAGVGMGYGTYSVMPIPYSMALIWFLGTVVEAAAAGLVTAAIVK